MTLTRPVCWAARPGTHEHHGVMAAWISLPHARKALGGATGGYTAARSRESSSFSAAIAAVSVLELRFSA